MSEFTRSEEYMSRIFLDALDRHVVTDATVTFQRRGGKLKAYCPETRTYLQFPRALRREGTTLKADVIKCANSSGSPFYRAYKGSIRDESGAVIG